MNYKTPSQPKNMILSTTNKYNTFRSLEIQQKRAEDINNFILDIDDFYVSIENYNLKIRIDLSILNTELNFKYQIKDINVSNLDVLDDKITYDYTGNNYFFLRYYDDKKYYKLYELKYIDYNDNNNLKIIYI